MITKARSYCTMQSITVEFRPLQSLTQAEAWTLLGLTFKPEENRSIFQQWIRHYWVQTSIYATLVRVEGDIVAWAAVAIHEAWNLGQIGVIVRPDHRGKGLARRALDVLLEHLPGIDDKNIPEYLSYNSGMERVFRPSIERFGFKDYSAHVAEYHEQERNVRAREGG